MIIIAEDDDDLRETVVQALSLFGFQVQSARDGIEAWNLLCASPFSLLITDNEMPGLRGLDLLRKMRAESFGQPVILMSGNLPWDAPDLSELLSPGAAIAKPFGINLLISTISAFIVA